MITTTGESRDRLSEQAYKALADNSPLGLLQEALEMSERFEPLEQKLRQARKEGLIQAEYLGHQIDEAARAEVISKAEADDLRDYHAKVQHLMAVDDFAPEELRRSAEAPKPTVKAAAKTKKKPAKKKVARKKKVSAKKAE